MTRRSLLDRPAVLEEAYADDFALSLLMPAGEVHRVYREGLGWAGMIVHFGVPQELAIRRLRDLGLEVRT